MLKWMLRFAILAVLIIALAVAASAFHLVRTDDGYHFIRKKEWSLSFPVVDTRDWNMRDWFDNPEIAREIGKLRLEDLGEEISREWAALSKRLDDLFSEADARISGEEARAELTKHYEKARKQVDKAIDRAREGSLSREKLEAEIAEAEAWLKRQIEKLER